MAFLINKYLGNTAWIAGEKVIRMVVTLAIGVYLARYLGPGKFGLLIFSNSFCTFFLIFSNLGLDGIVIRNLVYDQLRINNLLGTSFILKLFGSFTSLIFIVIALQLSSIDRFTSTMVLIIATGMVFQSFNVIDFFFQSRVLGKYTSIAYFNSIIISSLVKLYFIVIEAPLLWFAWVILLENILLAVFLILNYYRYGLSIFQWRFNRNMAVNLLRDSWPLILSGLGTIVFMRIDIVLIKLMLTDNAVGEYSAAARLSEAIYIIPISISAALFPAIIKAKNVSEDYYHLKLQKLYILFVWMAIAIALPITFLADSIIALLYGIKYIAAASVLRIHIWAGIFVFLGVASANYLLVENLTKISSLRTLLGALANIVLNIILIPPYGIIGSAWATLISYGIANFSLFFNGKARRCFFMMVFSFLPIKKYRELL